MSQPSNPFNDYVFLNATPAERGSFSLAMEKALEKLEKFQLPDATFFILQWVQAIVASGATRIKIQLDTQRLGQYYGLRISFDGPGYSYKELDTMYDHVFLSGRDRSVDRLRELALGWLSACSLNPETISIQSNGWYRLRNSETGKSERVSQIATQDEEGNEVEQDPLHHLSIGGKGAYSFYELVQTRCGDVPAMLTFNSEPVSTGQGVTGVPWPNRAFESGPTRGVMGATYGGAASSQIAFLRYGVNFVSRPEQALEPSVILRVNDASLSKNVSQTDVVRDEAYSEFLERVRREMKAMALSLTRKRIPAYQRDSLNKYIQAYLGSNLDVRALDDPDRLKRLGPDYQNLLEFPVFIRNGGKYVSLKQVYEVYKKMGCLLYCTDEQSRSASWAGMLLVLTHEEVVVLKKFCPNMISLSLSEVRGRSRSSGTGFGRAETRHRPLCRRELSVGDRKVMVVIPDCYPTGEAVLQRAGDLDQTRIPTLRTTLTVEYSGTPLDDSEVMHLAKKLPEALLGMLAQICSDVKSADSFSRLRYAELACEIINLQLERPEFSDQEPWEAIKGMGGAVRLTELIGLEDGRMVSLADMQAFLGVIPSLYLGGIFIDGVESGALDPMPCASILIHKVFAPHQLTPTERIRERLEKDPTLKQDLRRQTVMKGLGVHPDPARAIRQFATEAAAQEAELQRLEQEYRKAKEGPELFVKPDEDRLAELVDEDDEVELLDITALGPAREEQPTPSQPAKSSEAAGPPPLPSLEADLELCRLTDPDFLPPGPSVHVERRESTFTLHLATRRRLDLKGRLLLLEGEKLTALEHPLPIDGFLRVGTEERSVPELVSEAVEQLVNRVVHAFREGPESALMRKQLREWLHLVSCLDPQRLAGAISRRGWLYDLALVPCLGKKMLSWRTLREQYARDQHLLVADKDLPPNPSREVVLLAHPVGPELLKHLGFHNLKTWGGDAPEPDFETLYRSTRRDLSSILAGSDTPLLRPGIVAQLAEDASRWVRWRSGFLSWDAKQSIAVMNPKHKVGKRLVKQFSHDPSWSAIFASALFSTINRGLEEVEDHHERAFLEALMESRE